MTGDFGKNSVGRKKFILAVKFWLYLASIRVKIYGVHEIDDNRHVG